jgi:hypothetical protein
MESCRNIKVIVTCLFQWRLGRLNVLKRKSIQKNYKDDQTTSENCKRYCSAINNHYERWKISLYS